MNIHCLLQNRETKELLPVFGNALAFCQGGSTVFGSAETEDAKDVFVSHFEETKTAYIGNPTRNCIVSAGRETFPKTDWELILKPGDNVITTHVFWGADFSVDTVRYAFADGHRIAKECFPEYNVKAQRCCSWLLNPLINEVLGDTAKLSQFSAMFTRFPIESAGKAYANYVFPGVNGTYEELPENSRLQRGFKKHLLAGGQIYEYTGIRLF